MKRLIPIFTHLFLLLPFCMLSSSAKAQIVAPAGWNADSIRFSLWGDFFWGPWNIAGGSGWIVNLQMDSVLDNSVGDFGNVKKDFTPTGLRAHGAVDAQTGTVLDGLQSIRQRVYYAQQNPEFPASLPYGGYDHIYRWRYYDSGAIHHLMFPNSLSVEQIFGVNLKSLRDLREAIKAQLFFAAFYAGKIICVKGDLSCQSLLCEVSLFTIRPNVFCYDLVNCHECKV
jgi:hypothetical protein